MTDRKKPDEPVIEIKDRWTGKVLFTAKGATTIAAAVTMAVAAGASLNRANLYGASLTGASLDGASLDGASLTGANLDGASLNRANLYGASLNRANLNRANLYGASLNRANLYGASLTGASLDGANLAGANLYGSNLKNVKNLFYQIPQEGELIVWKAVAGGVCKLRVPPEAKRTATPIGRKCRAEWVEVLEAPTNGRGLHDTNVIYRAGEIVRPDKYDPDPRVECTHGIHFFLTKEEAEAYR
jgi:uncharacterized protein YjbI with pentapeptide repeats